MCAEVQAGTCSGGGWIVTAEACRQQLRAHSEGQRQESGVREWHGQVSCCGVSSERLEKRRVNRGDRVSQ